ncbi:hypothetical protein AB3329_10530 [Streptococcus sp. H31]|uniref:hypothetical protein n=1 Tax=Streptococcus huangxiaojuni TaxID=3237239 RepID=UPI0034A16AB2
MFDKLRNKVPSMGDKRIYYTPRVILLLILCIYVPVLIVVVSHYIKQGFLLNFQQFALISSCYFLFFLQDKVHNAVNMGVSDILYHHIDLKRYDAYSDFLLLKNSRFFNNSAVMKGIVEFYKGNFKEAEGYFFKVNKDKWKFTDKTLERLNYYFYLSLTELYLDNEELCLDYKQRLLNEKIRRKRLAILSKSYSDLIAEILKISQGERSLYFSDNDSKQNRLIEIMFTFYKGLNELNQGHTDRAKAFFDKIADENPDLFYVQEAKKYLN